MCSNSLRETIIGKLNRRFQILRECENHVAYGHDNEEGDLLPHLRIAMSAIKSHHLYVYAFLIYPPFSQR